MFDTGPRVTTRVGKAAGTVEDAGSPADESNGPADRPRGQMDASMVLNTSKMVAMGDGDGAGAKLDARDAKHNADAMDSLGS